jgi:hypothetical protein
MKVCLLIIGRVDTFERCYPHLKKHLLDPLQPDIFFSGHPNDEGLEYCDIKIRELWNPVDYLLRNYNSAVRREVHPNDTKFLTHMHASSTPPTWLSRMYNLKLANKMKRKAENKNNFKYDICIKSRTDTIWYQKISENELNLARAGNILIPTAWDFKVVHPDGISDVSCVTNSSGMDKYASCIDYIDQYWNEGLMFHPETMLGHHIKRSGLNRIEITHGVNQTGWCVIDPDRTKTQYEL